MHRFTNIQNFDQLLHIHVSINFIECLKKHFCVMAESLRLAVYFTNNTYTHKNSLKTVLKVIHKHLEVTIKK